MVLPFFSHLSWLSILLGLGHWGRMCPFSPQFQHFDCFTSLLYSTFPLALFVRTPVAFPPNDSSLIGFLNGLCLNSVSCALVFGFLLGAFVHVFVTLALLPQTPKRRQGHCVRFRIWLDVNLVLCHSPSSTLQKLVLPFSF